MDPGGLGAGRRRLHCDGRVARRRDGAIGCVVKAPSRTFAQLPVGPRPSTEGEPGTVGPGLGARTRGRTADLDLRDIWAGQGGGRHHGYTGQRGYHPLLAIAAGTGDVLMVRLREGRANSGRRSLPA